MNNVEQHRNHERLEKEHLTKMHVSLPLAISLYYNKLFSLVFAFLEAGLTHAKMNTYDFQNNLQKAALKPAFGLWCCIEIVRLYLGIHGTHKSNVPNMVSFVLLTLFPQVLLVLYVGFFQECVVTADKFLGGTLLGFLMMEICLGVDSLRVWAKLRTVEYSTNVKKSTVWKSSAAVSSP